MRLLLFIAIEIILLPIQLIGVAVYYRRLRRISIPRKISGTANEPYGARLAMHLAGTRRDEAAYRLAGHLPVYSRFVTWTVMDTLGLALRLSGYKGSFVAYPVPRPSNIGSMIGHRTEFFDKALADALVDGQVEQFVVLGAGFDTRCYDLPPGAEVRCFEVDMAPTLRAKREAVAAAGIAHEHVTYVETDFNQQTWLESLTQAGFDPSLPTFVLWEGVSMYLNDSAVRETLKEVATLPRVSAIAFDYFSKELLDCQPPYEKIGKAAQRSIVGFYKERLSWGLSTVKPARDKAERLLAECGLTLSRFQHSGQEQPPEIPMYCFVLADNR